MTEKHVRICDRCSKEVLLEKNGKQYAREDVVAFWSVLRTTRNREEQAFDLCDGCTRSALEVPPQAGL